ncbi:MAG: hypothetical protein WD989_02475 [Candidatus Paceibacterota bacterium]
MDEEILDQQEDIPEESTYATPYNVDLFLPKPKNFFTEYTQRVRALPEPVRNILMNHPTAEFIEENLGPSFNLNSEQKTEVTRIIRDVLLGDLSINEMASKVSEKLGADPTTAYQIQSKIISELLGPAIEDIKKTQKDLPSQSQYIPPSPKNQNTPANPNNVVDLRNRNNNQ